MPATITDSSTLQFTAEFDYEEGLIEGDFVTAPAPTGEAAFVGQITHTESNGEGVEAVVNVVGEFPDLPFREGDAIAKASSEAVLGALELPSAGLYVGDLRGFGTPIYLSPADVLEKQIGVYGKTGSGKSHTSQVVVEELLVAETPVIVIDPHGEYDALDRSERPGTGILPGRGLSAQRQVFAVREYADTEYVPDVEHELSADLDPEAIVEPRVASVLNLRGLRTDRIETVVAEVLDEVFTARMREEIPPVKIVLEEAHQFAPTRKNETRPVVEAIAKQGRKFGCSLVLVSQRPSDIYSSIRAQMQSTLVHKLTDETDIDKVTDSVEGLDTSWGTQIQKLATGEALVAGDLVESPAFVDVRGRGTESESESEGLIDGLLR